MPLPLKDKPILFLLDAPFFDAQSPGQPFVCRHSLLLEGALSRIAGLDQQLEIRHIAFSRPRHALIAEIGDADQSLPKLVLPSDVALAGTATVTGQRTVVSGAEPILAALATLLHIPAVHP